MFKIVVFIGLAFSCASAFCVELSGDHHGWSERGESCMVKVQSHSRNGFELYRFDFFLEGATLKGAQYGKLVTEGALEKRGGLDFRVVKDGIFGKQAYRVVLKGNDYGELSFYRLIKIKFIFGVPHYIEMGNCYIE